MNTSIDMSNMSSGCDLCNVAHLNTLYDLGYHYNVEVTSGIFFADAFLCMTFAFIAHSKYSSVTVLNYSVSTKATSNTRWIWFFIFTALSSLLIGINFLLSLKSNGDSTRVMFIIGWIAHLLAVLSLAFAIKYQWMYREEAFHKIRDVEESERTPILNEQIKSKRPSPVDGLLIVCFAIAIGFSIAGFVVTKRHDLKSAFYWIALSFNWFIRIVIFLMVLVVHYKLSREGPSIFTKCLLLAGVPCDAIYDIPSYIWIKCIMKYKDKDVHAQASFDILVGVVLLSHITFFVVLRNEFLRLKDITKWHIAGNIDRLQANSEAVTS